MGESGGYSARCRWLLELNREAAAVAMAAYRAEQRDREGRREADRDRHSGGRDRLARMIAPSGGGPTVAVSHRERQRGAPPSTPPPSARELQERESRRLAFLRQGVATGGSVLKAPRPSTHRNTETATESDREREGGTELGAVWRRLSEARVQRETEGDRGRQREDGDSSSPAASPRVKPLLTTADGREVYIDVGEPMELPSSSEDSQADGSSELSSPGMFGEGERALYSLYMDSISAADTFLPSSGDDSGDDSGEDRGAVWTERETGRETERQARGAGLPWSEQVPVKSSVESLWRSLNRPPTKPLEFSRRHLSIQQGHGGDDGPGRSSKGRGGASAGSSTIVLQSDGSFSQHIQVSSPGWSQIKRGRFVVTERDRDTRTERDRHTEAEAPGCALELEFHASGVQTQRESDDRQGDRETERSSLSPPGSPNTKLEASAGQLNQRWVARLEAVEDGSASHGWYLDCEGREYELLL